MTYWQRLRDYDFIHNIYHPLTIGLVVGYVAGQLDDDQRLVFFGVVAGVCYLGGLLLAAAAEWRNRS